MFSALRHLRYRPSLLLALGVGLAAGFAGRAMIPEASAWLFGWSAGVAAYLVYIVWTAGKATVEQIQMKADLLDEGGLAILVITAGAAVASLGAIFAELTGAKGGAHAGFAVTLAAVTVVLSWLFVHAVFAFHYAHQFYGGDPDGCCLEFPGTAKPLYWDFLYFSYVIGMTAQVSDVQVTTSPMRKLVLAHGIMSFFFNTAILALGVNLAASLAA